MILELVKYSVSNIWTRKLRSSLTILSILIGITAIFALIGFGQGINKYVNDFAQEMGSDKIMMMPGGFTAPGTSNILFTEDDVEFVRKIKGVEVVTAWMADTGKIGFRDFKDRYTYVFGFSTDLEEQILMEEMFTIGIEKGRNLKKGDVLKVLLGYNYGVPNKLFPKAVELGDKIKVNDVQVEVIGFYEEVGNPSDDSQVYITFDGMEEIFGPKDYEYIAVRSSPGEDPSALADKIKERFRKRRGQKEGEEDFVVQTFQDTIAAFTSVINILNGILILIAFISLIVAAVNIMNTMYTSVLERTREIGIMKAIGSRNRQILKVFVIESGILGLIGGILGVLLGYGIAKIGQAIARSAGLTFLKPYFPLWLIIGSIMFAFLVGAGSGLFPAIRASKQRPVDALRYE